MSVGGITPPPLATGLKEGLPMLVEVAPLRELRELQLTWMMPSMRSFYRTNPLRLFSHLLGHEGEGSVFAELQDIPSLAYCVYIIYIYTYIYICIYQETALC